MKPERWQQIDKLFDEILDCKANQRAAFLSDACGGDEELRQKVEALLAAAKQSESFLDRPALEVAAKVIADNLTQKLVGQSLSRYRILSLLDAGGMGVVYRGQDTRLGREVAIKVLPDYLAQDSTALMRFEREARTVAGLSHPNILAIHDFDVEHGICFAVMELLEGETLRSCLKRGAFPWRAAVEVAAAVADGLAAAHAKGVIHRDLKPENIFLTADGRVKILDFGLARIKPAASITSIDAESMESRRGGMLGTAGYMSPEQARGEEADAPSDIFSFGCVLYEMLTAERAFARPTAAETLAAILRDEPPPLTRANSDAPPALARVLRRCLEKDAAARYQSAGSLAADLQALLIDQSPSAVSPTIWLRHIHPRKQIVMWASILLMMLLSVVSLFVWFRRNPQTEKVNFSPTKSVPLTCKDATQKRPCTSVITTNGAGSITIQITRHASRGQLCGLYRPTDSDHPGEQIIPDSYIDSNNYRPQTFNGILPVGAKFVVWCKRNSDSGDADITGYVYYR